MWTPEFKAMILMAVLLGLAIGAVMAWAEVIESERTFIAYVYRPDDVPPADISALHEEVRKIQREADDA
jgi:hypothetical protein